MITYRSTVTWGISQRFVGYILLQSRRLVLGRETRPLRFHIKPACGPGCKLLQNMLRFGYSRSFPIDYALFFHKCITLSFRANSHFSTACLFVQRFIRDGRLIGAVTYVLRNSPDEGGWDILENMPAVSGIHKPPAPVKGAQAVCVIF